MQHLKKKKKISDQASAYAQREDNEWKYQKKSVPDGWFVIFHGFSQVDRSGRVEAVVARRSEFVLYS